MLGARGDVPRIALGLARLARVRSPISATGDTFQVFALVVLPTLFVLGVFTFVCLVESSVEDIFYGRAINRIRSYYVEHAGPDARYFMLASYDDASGVLRNMGLTASKWQTYFTSASAIAVVNSVVGAPPSRTTQYGALRGRLPQG